MKIQSTSANFYNFKAGMNQRVLNEISRVDCVEVQKYLLKNNGINADFANNKVIAWSVAKVVELFSDLQTRYHRPFFAPIQITTESLKSYGKDDEKDFLYGFTNFLPSRLKNDSEQVTPAMSIIFNKDFMWEKLDEISDSDYAKNQTATNHFLESFIHEFSHVIHEGYLLTKFNTNDAVERLKKLANPIKIGEFQENFGDLISKHICNYAKESPLDLIACDMSKRFIESLDTTLSLTKNPFKNSPYSKFYHFKNLLFVNNPLDDLINKVFNGQYTVYESIKR